MMGSFNYYYTLNLIMNDIIKKVSEELNIPKEVVEKAYRAYWFSIRNAIESLPLNEDIKEEDFKKLKVSFNIPSLGKLYCSYDKIVRAHEIYKRLNRSKIK